MLFDSLFSVREVVVVESATFRACGSCNLWSASSWRSCVAVFCPLLNSLYYEDRGIEIVIGKPYMRVCVRAYSCMYVCLYALTLPLDAMIDEMYFELIWTQPVKRNSTYSL